MLGATEDIVGGYFKKIGELYEDVHRELSLSVFILGIGILFNMKIFRNNALGNIPILSQILKTHPSSLLH